ncbi:RNA polymerase sigma factor [Enemella sp. A6]|uniref:RNA polymerase sigma factor n=1 Tax=Enemella sp. A6 TaxID=3440152 RepID=UPI003EBC90D0
MKETERGEEAEELRELVNGFASRVYAYVRRRVPVDDAESIVNDVFLTAWRKLNRLPDDPLPWLLVTARKLAANQIRANGRQRDLHQRVADLGDIAHHPAVDDLAVERSMLLTALAELSDDDREALLLVGWDGLDHREAAKVAGCSAGAFSARLARARTRLHRKLDPDAPETLPTLTPFAQMTGDCHDRV